MYIIRQCLHIYPAHIPIFVKFLSSSSDLFVTLHVQYTIAGISPTDNVLCMIVKFLLEAPTPSIKALYIVIKILNCGHACPQFQRSFRDFKNTNTYMLEVAYRKTIDCVYVWMYPQYITWLIAVLSIHAMVVSMKAVSEACDSLYNWAPMYYT